VIEVVALAVLGFGVHYLRNIFLEVRSIRAMMNDDRDIEP
jgi:hypothetical protein